MEQCKATVPDGGRSVRFHQCSRKAVRDGYCKQHHPDAVRAREEASEKRWREKQRKSPYAVSERLRSKVKAFEDALDPDQTKKLLIGEFSVEFPYYSEDGEEVASSVNIPLNVIKDIQRAILERARLNMGWRCSGCGSSRHILAIRDSGSVSCCPERKLVPPEEQEGGE